MRALFGLRGETFDAAIRQVVTRHNRAVYVPLDFDPTPDRFSADGFHPSKESYRQFGRMMAAGILEGVDDEQEPAPVSRRSASFAA